MRQGREIRSWADFETAWQKRQNVHHADEGAGLRLLTGRITSPTLLRQIKALQSSYPRVVWHAYEPLESAPQDQPAKIAFRRPLEILPRLSNASVVL